jgi:hypothetical protein
MDSDARGAAYHEAGHAIVGWSVDWVVLKVDISAGDGAGRICFNRSKVCWFIGFGRIKRWSFASVVVLAALGVVWFLAFAVAYAFGWPLGVVTFVVAGIWVGRRVWNAYRNARTRRMLDDFRRGVGRR